MKLWIPISRSIVIFLSLILLTNSITKPSGFIPRWEENGRIIKFPHSEKVFKPKWIELKAVVDSGKGIYLVLPRTGLSNIRVKLNGETIWQSGDENHHSRMWTQTFVVTLDPKESESIISIESYVLYDFRINWPPYITRHPWTKVFLSNLVFSELSLAFFGFALVLAFLVFRISSYTEDVLGNTALGISMIIAAFLMLDYSYLGLFVSARAFLIMRKVFYSLSYLSILGFFYSMERVMLKVRVPRRTFALLLAFSLLPMVVPGIGLSRLFTLLMSPVLALIALKVLVDVIRYGKYYLVGPVTFLTASVTYTVVAIWRFPNPSLLNFGIACLMFATIEHLYREFRVLSRTAIITKEKSLVDPLTDAFNRRVFEEIPRDLKGSLVFLDLDNFKAFNDTYGHEKGDEILKEFSKTVESRLRKGDLFIRYGGDEFVLILSNCDVEKAKEIAEEIMEKFKEKTGLSFSYGISHFKGDLTSSIREADKKMYYMKKVRGG